MAPTVGLVQKGWYATPGSVEMSSPPLESMPLVKLKGVAREQSVGLTGPAAPTKPLPTCNWRLVCWLCLRRTVLLSPMTTTAKMKELPAGGTVGTLLAEVVVPLEVLEVLEVELVDGTLPVIDSEPVSVAEVSVLVNVALSVALSVALPVTVPVAEPVPVALSVDGGVETMVPLEQDWAWVKISIIPQTRVQF